MKNISNAGKLPEITLLFWVMKICATTLGETAGDLLSMTLKVGYAAASVILFAAFFASLGGQLRSKTYHPVLYWTVILTTSTAGTTMSDFIDRSLGIGYASGSVLLVGLLLTTLFFWWKSEKSLSVTDISTRRGELFYWTAILFSNTLGTALGDFLADDSGLGFAGGAVLIGSLLALVVLAFYFTKISHIALFWAAFVLTRPFGATFGDLLTKPLEKGGLGFGTIGSSVVLFGILAVLIFWALKKHKKATLAVVIPLFLLGTTSSTAQTTVSGYVRDAANGEALIGASVAAPDFKTGTATNTYGYFSLSLPAKTGDSVTLVFSYLGFQPLALRFKSGLKNEKLDINLVAEGRELNEVVIKAKADDDNVQRTQMSVINLPVSQIKAIPVIAGERDVLKAVQFLPGVSAGSGGTTGFYVRGGNIDQNLVLLDEAVVYNPNHLFGLVSTFNVNALNSVNLIKGGFPAQYGGRLSSVLDVTMREGNKKHFSGEGGIGLISSNLTLEAPIQKGKSSFIVSGRRSYLDLFLLPFNKGGNKTDYKLYDLNVKVNYELGKNDHLFASVFKGADRAQYTGANALNYGIGFGNSTATLRWNHLFGDKVFSNTSLIYNKYHLGLNTTQGKYYALLYSEIRDFAAKTSVEWYPNARYSVKIGAQIQQHALSPASVSAQIPKANKPRLQIVPDSIPRKYASEAAFFANNEIRLGSRFGASVGVRVPVFSAQSKTYVAVEPRLTLKYSVSQSASVKAAFTEMNQFLHLVPSSTASLPTDIWIASSPKVTPQTSRQFALGYFQNFAENQYEASIEGYFKTMHNQVLFKEGTQITLTADIENQLVFGKGDSYGIELFVRKNTGRLTGWLSYTLSKTTQTFADLNFGKPFPFTYDRRHNLSVVGIFELNKKWSFSADFVFNTGSAYTLATGRVPVFGDGSLYDGIYYDFTSRNNYRLGNYHRLDVSASRHKTKHWFHKKVETEWVFGAYNLYSRRNPYFVYLTTDAATRAPVAKQVSLLPIVPSVSWNFKF